MSTIRVLVWPCISWWGTDTYTSGGSSSCGTRCWSHGLRSEASVAPMVAVSKEPNHSTTSMTYMILLLAKEMPIINSQLGITAKAQKTYPRGTARPALASQPSNGWKAPS